MITTDAAALEAKYAGTSTAQRDGDPKAFDPNTGEMTIGTPVPEGQVVSQRVGRAQAPSMMVMPPGSTQTPSGGPQIAVIPPTGAARTSLGTYVELGNSNPMSQTMPEFVNDIDNSERIVTAGQALVAKVLEPEKRKPKLDLTQAMLDHIHELGGHKSEKCQNFYNRSSSAIQNWVQRPAMIPLDAVCRYLAKKPELMIEIEEDLEPHFSASHDDGYAQSLPNRGKTSVVVCSPVLERPTLPFLWTLLYLAKKYELGFDIQSDTVIARSRNMLAKRFLESNADWSLWIDGDMACPIANKDWFKWVTGVTQVPDAYTNYDVLTRLQSHGKGIVGGIYASRKYHGRLVIQPEIKPRGQEDLQLCNNIRKGTATGLVQVGWIGFGCALVHRQIFLEVQARFPQLAPQEEHAPWRYFQQEGDEGEDEAFCKRVSACNIPIWLDTQLICGHVGSMCYLPEHTTGLPTV